MFKIRPKYVFYLTILCSFFINNTYAEDTGEKLSSGCLGCHGIVSYSNIYPYFLPIKLINQVAIIAPMAMPTTEIDIGKVASDLIGLI